MEQVVREYTLYYDGDLTKVVVNGKRRPSGSSGWVLHRNDKEEKQSTSQLIEVEDNQEARLTEVRRFLLGKGERIIGLFPVRETMHIVTEPNPGAASPIKRPTGSPYDLSDPRHPANRPANKGSKG